MDRMKAKARETAEAAAAAAAQAAADAATKMMKLNAHLSAGEEGTMANLKSKLSYIGSVAMAGGPEAYWRANFEPPKEERLLAYFGCHLATPVPCRRNSDRNVLVGRRIDLFLAYCLWVKWLLHLLLIGWNLEQKTKWEM